MTRRSPPVPLQSAPDMFLSAGELYALTHKKRRAAQVAALHSMGLAFKLRPDGTVLVLRAHVENALGGTAQGAKLENKTEPNWDAI